MSTTAGDQINGALRLLGVLAEGETPSASISQDSLYALNQMLDSWSIERLSVYTTNDQTFTWPANAASRTMGASGNFVGTRPVQVDTSTYFVDSSNISHSVQFINEAQYNAIAAKATTSTWPNVCYVNNGYPDITMFVYPVPTVATTWHIISVTQLSEPATIATELSFPPGYLRCFRYNLACELAPEFGIEPSQQVLRIAMISKRDIERINATDDVMSMPVSLVASRNAYNIYAGNF